MRRTGILLLVVLSGWSMGVMAADSPCLDCHEGVVTSTATAIHTRVAGLSCETCHPTAMDHVESGETEGLIVENPQNQCFSCHADLQCDGEHCGRETFTCESCHRIHHGKGETMLKGDGTRVCEACHKDVKAEMNLPNHHPVPEGKMSCVSCHSPHRSEKISEATGSDINALCFNCHSRYQGPYIF